MYLRFVCGHRHPYLDAELGIYNAAHFIWLEDQPAWLIAAYEDAFGVLYGMVEPECVSDFSQTRDGRLSLCWVRAERRDLVTGFRYLAWAMTELGVPIGEIRTTDPGRILYRDRDQIVAQPNRGRVPKCFPRLRHAPRAR
ncbi:MAG: hypothetical protein AAGE80_10365 [Pseudomonadota bacterium]